MFRFIATLFFITIVTSCSGSKILFIFQNPLGSHYILASKLCKEIAKRGHEVTFITPFLEKSPAENVREIHVEGLDRILEEAMSLPIASSPSFFDKAKLVMEITYDFVHHVISNENVQNLLQSDEKFDAVLLYHYLNDALLGIAHHLKAPLILFSSMPLYTPESFLLSHPNPSSYVPNIITDHTGRMNFWQRLKNSIYDVYMILYYQWFTLPKHRELVRKYVPGEPDLYDFLNNGSVLLINSHASVTEAIPLVPNAIEVGGFHIEEPKALPKELQKYLDDSKNGVIYFSMGSIFKSVNFPEEVRKVLLRTFAKLKENVLWKFEDENLAGLPKNVKIMKWIPQADVLAHPNVKAFISHGGLLSTLESVYHGVPIIGIPQFADQRMNTAFAREHGYGIQLLVEDLTEETLSAAIHQILTNPKYRENVKKRSNILRDRPIRPMDSIIYWIEYVIRHEGAPHLRYPGMDLSWFQRNLLDVVAFVVLVPVLSILILVKIVKSIFRSSVKSKKE